MRLNTVRLSGFKSFADATQFQLPGQLIGVVGPNGCGKSNIIDAVRWVLGESKASELRGDSMQDVIFNGSTRRKPAGRASVELVFANDAGRAGGHWGRYAELAVKRVLTRDGGSTYTINGQAARRRDVHDVFLGTGLGPRAYAIIGQGTISRIIESRPDELRLFLEEAAGVSKYKERRRDTEARLRDTRENLTRVDDVLRELDGQLDKLRKQAAVAQRYQSLRQLADRRRQQFWHAQQLSTSAELGRLDATAQAAEAALARQLAEAEHGAAALHALRAARDAVAERLHAAVGALAEAALEVSRLEERLRQLADARRRLGERRAVTVAQHGQWQQRRGEAEAQLVQSGQRLAVAEVVAGTAAEAARAQSAALPGVLDALVAAKSRRAERHAALVALQQQAQVLAAEVRHTEDRLRQAGGQRTRLVDDRSALSAPLQAAIDDLQARSAAAGAHSADCDAEEQRLAEEAPRLDAARRAAQALAQADASSASASAARLETLVTLQSRLRTGGPLQPWLARHAWSAQPPLWQRVRIAAGWETALEAVLRERTGAVQVDAFDALAVAQRPPARVVLHTLPAVPSVAGREPERWVDAGASLGGAPASAPQPEPFTPTHGVDGDTPDLATLLAWDAGVDGRMAALLATWLEGVACCDTLAEALRRQPHLGPRQRLVTRAGDIVDRHAVAFHAPDATNAGALARERDIAALRTEVAAQQAAADASRVALQRTEAACALSAEARAGTRAAASAARGHALRHASEWQAAVRRAEQSAAEAARLDAQMAGIDAELARLNQAVAAARDRLAALADATAAARAADADAEDALIGQEGRVAEARDAQRRLEREAQDAGYAVRSEDARHRELQRSIAAAEQHATAAVDELERLDAELVALDDAGTADRLHAALALRRQREAGAAAARAEDEALRGQLRAADEDRLRRDQALAPLQANLHQLQLAAQAARIADAGWTAELERFGADRAAIAASIAEDGVDVAGLPAEIDAVDARATALGSVNLAALDEVAAADERKAFLAAQCADLTTAIGTLEAAIRRIDLDTRELLRATFDQVNVHFARMFPVLFGGGEARLAMTGGELLDAGVQVWAQPPGKKNSSIHLLSGGEKALTAIALVFAIFQLNPAPFCLLDEVDAPLDDANTERYARLVRDMSAATQFLFISHNRIAMEMAGQLIGVTMQEQGVSRIVAVDVNSAVELAEAA